MRYVFLPQDIFEDLHSLADKDNNENQGFLVYIPFEENGVEYCVVMASYMTAVGSEIGISDTEGRGDVFNDFLEKFPEYRPIRFHTHTHETINNYRDPKYPNRDLAHEFSSIDDEGMKSVLDDYPEHIEMLVTPYTQILKSRDDTPELAIVNRSELATLYNHILKNRRDSEADDVNARNIGVIIGRYHTERKEIEDALSGFEELLDVSPL